MVPANVRLYFAINAPVSMHIHHSTSFHS